MTETMRIPKEAEALAEDYRRLIVKIMDLKEDSERRASILEWAKSCSETNCGWHEYGVAQLVLEEFGEKP